MRRRARRFAESEAGDSSALQYVFLAAVLALAIMGSAAGVAHGVLLYMDTAPPVGLFD